MSHPPHHGGRPRARSRPLTLALLWAIRLLPLTVLYDLAPEVIAWAQGAPGAAEELDEAAPVVLGVGALRALAGSFAITPIATLTGWTWHLPLRRDLGRWAFALAALDLFFAVALSERGAVAGASGRIFLTLGTLATLLLLPMALTSNRWSQLRLGRWWKRLHLLIYPILAILVAHLLLLPDGPSSTLQMTWLFGPSLALRIPALRRRIIRWRLAATRAWRARRRAAPARWSARRRRRVVATAVLLPVLVTAALTGVAIRGTGFADWLGPLGPGDDEAAEAEAAPAGARTTPAPAAPPAPAPAPPDDSGEDEAQEEREAEAAPPATTTPRAQQSSSGSGDEDATRPRRRGRERRGGRRSRGEGRRERRRDGTRRTTST